MSIVNALAGVAVKNLRDASTWYAELIEAPGKQPMEGVVEWSLPLGGALQLFVDAKRAGSSSVTLSIEGLAAKILWLGKSGIAVKSKSTTPEVSTAIIEDPDGNQVVLAEQHSSKIAK